MPATDKPSAKRQYTTMACFACQTTSVMEKFPVAPTAQPGTEIVVIRLMIRGIVLRWMNPLVEDSICTDTAFTRLPLRVAIELLSNRVHQLCCFIQENGLQAPPMQKEKATALANVLETTGLSKVATSSPEASSSQGLPDKLAESTNIDTAQPHTAPTTSCKVGYSNTIQASIRQQRMEEYSPTGSVCDCVRSQNTRNSATVNNLNVENSLTSPPALEQENTTFVDNEPPLVDDSSDTEGIEDLIDQLSDRVGTLRIGPRGETQFYGPTSTFNLVDMPVSEHSITQNVLLNNNDDSLDRLGINQEIPIDLEEHLVNLYFSWHNPACRIVDRKRYEAAKEVSHSETDPSPFYSESLRNAICAIGASFETRYHPTFVTFPRSLMDFFGDRAKALLEIELDHPSLATVQTLVILSSHEIGRKRDARGWLYSGMAIRLAFDLALHIDMSAHISKGIISAADASLRRQVFWASYINDHLLGFSLGRPFRIHVEDVTVGKPIDHIDQFGQNTWLPYVLPSPLDTSYSQVDYTEAVSYQHITLCEIMSSCGYILYGTSGFSRNELQELNANIVADLRNWKESLPPTLQVNVNNRAPSYLPHVLLLHPPQGPGYLHARNMCIKSAIAIAKILDLYEVRYPLRRIHIQAVSITSSAILLLLFAAVSGYPSRRHDDIVLYLSTCLRALDEFGLSWESAKRAKDFFVRLQRQWEMRTRTFKSTRRSDSNNSCSHSALNMQQRPRKGPQDQPDTYATTASNNDDYLGATQLEEESHTDINVDVDLDWMLMSDMPALPENRDTDLYCLVSNQSMFDLERPNG
ncbi:Nitrogen assimilation transcription factor nit-4 [Talaromyces islandicus]|uniref:Nitrogen assimilation transcription factor nit-4 n=1 Tax=Talaromyces islandicus TaxID=28573 RepID=A0A0U1LM15_TALIS|nr:Nitrogen assimilation transcription factor nit-4 [Talaromyces islandicus]